MSGETVLNLFVSSPGDVQRERERIDFVVARLNAEYRGRVRIATVRWETHYYSSHDTFQAQIPEAAACDLVLAIFGARLGSPLPESFRPMSTGERYPSGTAYEVLSAIDARRQGQGTPDVYVFRRPLAPLVALDAPDRAEIEEQWRRLAAFFETWFRNRGGEFLAAFQEFVTTDEFAVKIEDCLRQWLARRGFPPKTATWDRAAKGSPYPGLASFDESRKNVYFGRSLVIEQAIRRLREVEAPANESGRVPFLLLIGASGSGKSSLLRAGLLPRIGLPGELPEVDLWRRAIMVPGLDPFLSLAHSLLTPDALGPELSSGPFRTREILASQLAGNPDAAVAPLRAALEVAAEARRREGHFETARPARLFLAIDQAERLLLETAAELQPRFAALIEALCRHRLATVVVALRSDAYARFQSLDALVALRDAGATLDLLPATQSELEEMATRPAELCEPPLQFERRDGRSLATTLVEDARGGDALPLLQMTLARLNAAEAARGDGVLRFADYKGLGDAVGQTANEALAGLDPAARAQLPYLIAGLVRDFATDPLTSKPVATIGALDRARFESGRPERKALVEAFVVKRLLTAEGDAATQRVRPTHESLLRIWPEAVKIVEAASHLIRARAAIQPAARDWAEADAADKARHLEISPALLEGAMAYVEWFGDEVDPTTKRFVAEAAAVARERGERERLERERKLADAQAIARANRRIARTTGVGLVAALVLAALAGWQWRSAVSAQHEAQTQRDRAERSLTAAIQTADSLVFDLAQKFRNLTGAPKPVVKQILDQARQLQEQLLNSGETNSKLTANHAAALGEIATTELSLGDAPAALGFARQARDIYASILAGKPDDVPFIHNLAFSDEMVGDILKRQGQFDESRSAYDAGRALVEAALARDPKDLRLRLDRSLIVQDIADLVRSRGDNEGALKWYQDGLAMARALADDQPNDAFALHGLAVAHRNVGDTRLKLGAVDAAAEEFDAASDIARKLAQDHPDNTLLQRDYTLSQERLGDTLTAKHDYAGALKAFSDGEATAIVLIGTDPANLEWQYDVSIGHIEVGDAQLALEDLAGAIQSYRQSVAIDKMLTAKDPTDALWRRHYSQALERLGDALDKHADSTEALDVNREAFAFATQALARDPADSDWVQRAIRSEDKVGGGLLSAGKYDEALAAFQDALARARALGATKEGRELVFASLMRIGGAFSLKSDAGSALAAYEQAETLAREDISHDPKSLEPRGKLTLLLVSKAHMLALVGRAPDGAAALREAIALSGALAAEKPGDASWPREQATAYDRLGDDLRQSGDPTGAIEAYRKSLAIMAGLPAAKQSDADFRTELTLTQEALSAVLESQKDYPGAVASMTAAIALRKGLADEAPGDMKKRRLQLIDDNVLGRLLNLNNDSQAALAAFRNGLAVAQSLAVAADATPVARNDLIISLFLVGLQFTKSGDAKGGATYLAQALPIAQALAAQTPSNAQYQREIILVGNFLGDALLAADDRAGALNAYLAARETIKANLGTANADLGNADQLKLIVEKIGRAANAMVFAGDFKGALAALDQATPAAPDQNWFDLVRAAAFMFLDRPDEARAIYVKRRGETTFGGKSWEAATLEGFALLREKGFVNPLMDEIATLYATPK